MVSTFTDRTGLLHTSPAHAERRILALGGLSVALYALSWIVERGLARNEVEAWPNILESPFAAPSVPLLLLDAVTYLAATLMTVLLARRCRSAAAAATRDIAAARLEFQATNLMLVPMVANAPVAGIKIMAHGLLGVIPGGNPLTQPADAVRDAVVGANLVEYGWHTYPGITPYGILWTRIEVAIAALSHGDVLTGMLLFKAVAVAASLGSSALIWGVLGRISPRLQLLGTLAYLWNPLVLMEFAAEGHNDALMILRPRDLILTPLQPIAQPLGALLLTTPLLMYVAWSSWRLRVAPDLTRAWAWTSVIFLLVSSPDYWPWYATMPIALVQRREMTSMAGAAADPPRAAGAAVHARFGRVERVDPSEPRFTIQSKHE